MYKKGHILVLLVLNTLLLNCSQKTINKEDLMTPEIGTYAYDVQFLRKHNINTLELKTSDSQARVLLSPEYQGRVMTSSGSGIDGRSFGWINYDFIESGEVNPQFNPIGGEERFWLGPEGGPFSIYFPPGKEQTFQHWNVPEVLDTKPFHVEFQLPESVVFTTQFDLTNASGTNLQVGVRRAVSILTRKQSAELLGVSLDEAIDLVAYQSENDLFNLGTDKWSSSTGFLSIWLLSMFNPSEKGIVFIPYQEGSVDDLGEIVNDDYFGKVPEDRLVAKEGVLYFKVDGQKRSKIGLSPLRAKNWAGSYDEINQHLTILWYSKPSDTLPYVNSKWGDQDDPLQGDVLNSYNDGPVEDGSVMGPFYELESSSPAALLEAGEKITHTQRIFHLSGDEHYLNEITKSLFGIELNQIKKVFGN